MGSLLAVRAGSAYDPPGREGLARVAAELVALQGARLVELGPEIVLFTLDLEKSAALARWLSAPTVSPAALAAVVEPLLNRTPGCEEIAEAALDRWQFAGHPYRGPLAGRRSTLSGLRPEEVVSFLRARYVRDGIALSGPAVPALDQSLSTQLSRRVTPAALSPGGLTGEVTLVVKAESRCGVVASDQEPDPQVWEWARRAWTAEQQSEDQVQGQWIDLRVQRPVRLMGDPQKILERARAGWEAPAWQAAQQGEWPAARLGSVLLGGPGFRPRSPIAVSPALNQQLREWLVEGPHRVVVVTPDVTEYLGPEGQPRPGVLAVVTSEEIFQ